MMSQIAEIKVPDIGGADNVDVIEVAVKIGDTIAVDDTLVTLETDKATMDVPADIAGTVKAVHIKVGDKVSEGSIIVEIEIEVESESPEDKSEPETKVENSLTAPTAEKAEASKAESTVTPKAEPALTVDTNTAQAPKAASPTESVR